MPMKMRLGWCAMAGVLLLAARPAAPQAWAKANLNQSPRHGEYVTLTEPSGRKVQAWVVYPQVKDKVPVVVMVHEIFGLSDWAREMADDVAGAGYIVIEPDLLSGYGPATTQPAAIKPQAQSPVAGMPGAGCDPMNCPPGHKKVEEPDAKAREQMLAPGAPYVPARPGGTSAFPDRDAVVKAVSNLPDAVVMADLDAAANYGKTLPAADGKLFVAGFCWGGGKSFLFATHRKDLTGTFVFYGPPPPAAAMANITAPVYGFYGGMDERITSTVPQTQAEMKAAGKDYEPVVYDGAGHGFMREGEAPEATAANSAARAAGFRRLISLLGGIR